MKKLLSQLIDNKHNNNKIVLSKKIKLLLIKKSVINDNKNKIHYVSNNDKQ